MTEEELHEWARRSKEIGEMVCKVAGIKMVPQGPPPPGGIPSSDLPNQNAWIDQVKKINGILELVRALLPWVGVAWPSDAGLRAELQALKERVSREVLR